MQARCQRLGSLGVHRRAIRVLSANRVARCRVLRPAVPPGNTDWTLDDTVSVQHNLQQVQEAGHEVLDHEPDTQARKRKEATPTWWQSGRWVAAAVAALAVVVAVAMTTLAGDVSPAMAAAAGAHDTSPLASFSQWLGARTLFLLDKISGLHVVVKVVLVISSTLPFVLLFGGLYTYLTSTAFTQSCVKMYALLNRLPGAAVLNEKSVPAAVLVNAVFYIGAFTFAVFLGVVTDEVKTTFKNFRDGHFPVMQSGHLVILNWNAQSISLLRQLAAAKKAGQGGIYSKPVAILADVPKLQMDSMIQKRLKGMDIEVLTRSGSPTVPSDLECVAAQQAAAVIMMSPEHHTPPALTSSMLGTIPAQTAVALATLPNSVKHMVFQSPQQTQFSTDHVRTFKRLSGDLGANIQLIDYSDQTILTRMLAVSALQPGMYGVVMRILGPGDASFQAVPVPPELQGRTYQSARRSYADGVVCGLLMDRKVDLLIPETRVLTSKDRLVLLSTQERVELNPQAEQVFTHVAGDVAARVKDKTGFHSHARHIIVIALDYGESQGMADVLGEFLPKGSTATFLLPSPAPSTAPQRKGHCTFKYLSAVGPDGKFDAASLLREAGVDHACSVVVTGLHTLLPLEADAFVTAALLQLFEVSKGCRGSPPHLVAQIQRHSTRSTLAAYMNLLKKQNVAASSPALPAPKKDAPAASDGPVLGPDASSRYLNLPDLVHCDDMVTTMLAQSASQPVYWYMVQTLLSSEGAELYFRAPSVFNLRCGDLLTFADVAETARVFHETAIGVVARGKVILAPEPTYPINFQEGDKVIVLAEQYETAKVKRA